MTSRNYLGWAGFSRNLGIFPLLISCKISWLSEQIFESFFREQCSEAKSLMASEEIWTITGLFTSPSLLLNAQCFCTASVIYMIPRLGYSVVSSEELSSEAAVIRIFEMFLASLPRRANVFCIAPYTLTALKRNGHASSVNSLYHPCSLASLRGSLP